TDSGRVARPGYNRAMPKAVGRRLGTAVLVGLVASVLLLTLLPADPGSLRFGGVGALWRLAVIVAPLAGTLSVGALAPRRADGGPRRGAGAARRRVAAAPGARAARVRRCAPRDRRRGLHAPRGRRRNHRRGRALAGLERGRVAPRLHVRRAERLGDGRARPR